MIDDRGMKVPIFTEPDGPLYIREIANYDFVTSHPLLPDPYESATVECRASKVPHAGEGLFAKIKIEPNIVLAFYNCQVNLQFIR